MLELLFFILMFIIFGKLIWLAIKMAWGVSKIVFGIILLPLILIGLVIAGLVKFAIPILVIIGIISIFRKRSE